MLPPIVTIIGRKNAGKTTLVVRLCAALHARGLRVMTIKHGSHTFNIDPSTTDTYRHYHEGNAERVAMVSPDKFALVTRHDHEPAAEEIVARYMTDADVVLCEGFKRSVIPKIEIHRGTVHATPLYGSGVLDDRTVRALVSDEVLAIPVPRFGLDELTALTDFVVRDIMKRQVPA